MEPFLIRYINLIQIISFVIDPRDESQTIVRHNELQILIIWTIAYIPSGPRLLTSI